MQSVGVVIYRDRAEVKRVVPALSKKVVKATDLSLDCAVDDGIVWSMVIYNSL